MTSSFFKHRSILLTALIFFSIGFISSLIYTQKSRYLTQAQDSGIVSEKVQQSPIPTETPSWTPYPTVAAGEVNSIVQNNSSITKSSKFTILEVQKITADKTSAQTGENVNFTVTIKNTGSTKKLLTHICFNHSGGVTFGCIREMNLEAGDKFNVNNTMQFTAPGTYSVWITWSQDHTNFYRPQNSGSAVVHVI